MKRAVSYNERAWAVDLISEIKRWSAALELHCIRNAVMIPPSNIFFVLVIRENAEKESC
jgi:hypothetical protein